jgi:hypothetical protein
MKYITVKDFDFDNPPEWAIKVKILTPDKSGRWKVGEIGFELKNEYPEKYDYMIVLRPGVLSPAELESYPEFLRVSPYERIYFFYEHEIEIVKGD